MSGNHSKGEKMEIEKNLEELEKDIQDLKTLMLTEDNKSPEKELISLRGIGKPLFSEEKLDETIKEAKKSLFHGVKDVIPFIDDFSPSPVHYPYRKLI